MYELVIEDATIVGPEGRRVADIAVEDGRIAYIGSRPGGPARKKLSAIGRFALPGLIDTHVHFRSPGHPHKEDWGSGSRAALSGGVTTVLDMPNTDPPTLTRADWVQKRDLALAHSRADFGIWVGAAADNLDAMNDLMDSGDACGIKIFMGGSTGPLLVDSPTLERVYRDTRGLLGVHAEDEPTLAAFRDRLRAEVAPDHNAVRPPAAAAEAVRQLITLTRAYGRATHICHVSTAVELALLDDTRGDLPLTVEVCPHHLWLSTDDTLGNFMKCNPPIRSDEDRRALWTAIRRSRVDTVGSDHAPHTRAEKERPYWEAPSGIPGVETTLPLALAAVKQGKLTVERLVQLCCEAPARIFGLPRKGAIQVGYDADLVLVADGDLVRLEEKDLLTRVGWSPFTGQKVARKPEHVFLRGTLVAQRGQIVNDDLRGQLIRPEQR